MSYCLQRLPFSKIHFLLITVMCVYAIQEIQLSSVCDSVFVCVCKNLLRKPNLGGVHSNENDWACLQSEIQMPLKNYIIISITFLVLKQNFTTTKTIHSSLCFSFCFCLNIRKYFRCVTERCVRVCGIDGNGDRSKWLYMKEYEWGVKGILNSVTQLRTRIRGYYLEYHIFRVFFLFVYSFLYHNMCRLCRI